MELFKNIYQSLSVDYSNLGKDVTSIEMLGHPLTNDELGCLVGAPDGSHIEVELETISVEFEGELNYVVGFKATLHNEVLEQPMKRLLFELGGSVAILDNVIFLIKPEFRGEKLAARSLAYQIKMGRSKKFRFIYANAVGGPDSIYTGWKVWPRMGFDAVIPIEILMKIPSAKLEAHQIDVTQPVTLGQLLDKQCYELWEEFGTGINMQIDLQNLNARAIQLVAEYAFTSQNGE